jgi:hypothetical protein
VNKYYPYLDPKVPAPLKLRTKNNALNLRWWAVQVFDPRLGPAAARAQQVPAHDHDAKALRGKETVSSGVARQNRASDTERMLRKATIGACIGYSIVCDECLVDCYFASIKEVWHRVMGAVTGPLLLLADRGTSGPVTDGQKTRYHVRHFCRLRALQPIHT